MPRVVSLYLPTFATDLIRRRSAQSRARSGTLDQPTRAGQGARRPPDPPVITVSKDGSRRLVAAADAVALATGIRPGLPVAQVQAAVPGVAIHEATPEGDVAALASLAAWCLRYTPLVQADPPDGILLDVEGAAHLRGGEAALLADLGHRLVQAGFAAQTGLADTPGGAWALARHAPGRIAERGKTADAVSSLPVAGLRLTRDALADLSLLAIHRIGDLDRLPRTGLSLRFGPELLRRRDQVLGLFPEPLAPLLSDTAPQCRLAFAEPLGGTEGLTAALGQLTSDLSAELAERCAGLRRLDAIFHRVDGQPLALRVGTAAPTLDPTHLLRLLCEKLPSLDPGFGIDAIVLVATRTEPLRDRQLRAALADEERDGVTDGLAPLVDRLGGRLGAGRVFRLAPVESRIPERSARRLPPLAAPTGASWPPSLPRPSRLIDPPEPVTAFAAVPDDPPASFIWRRVRYLVRAADGPERIRGEWWGNEAETASVRDYYRVEDTAGRRFWLFRDAPMSAEGRWWLHGRFS